MGSAIGVAATLKLGRRVFFTAVALVMIVSGSFLAFTNLNPHMMNKDAIVDNGAVAVPANGYANVTMRFNATGYYMLGGSEPTNENDSLQRIYLNATLMDQATFNAWQKGQLQPNWSEYYEMYTMGSFKNNNLKTTYNFVLANQNATDTQVYYTIYREWNEYNYVGLFTLVGGIALLPAGVATFYFSNREKIKQINKALENQE